MKKALGEVKAFVATLVEKAKLRKGMISILAILFVLQLYFVRELIAAELLFGLAFAVLLAIGAMIYLAGALGERGLAFTEVGIRMISDATRRGYNGLEDLTRKAMRLPRSESPQLSLSADRTPETSRARVLIASRGYHHHHRF